MAMSDLIPWRWGGLRPQSDKPFESFRSEMDTLHRNIDRLFEEAWSGGFTPQLLSGDWTRRELVPQTDVAEDDKAFRVTVELPGMVEKDVEVSLTERVLTIRGEKKEEKEEKKKDVYRRERAFGSFRRSMELPAEIDADKIQASFKNGVLTIDLPKTKAAQDKVRQIPVKAA